MTELKLRLILSLSLLNGLPEQNLRIGFAIGHACIFLLGEYDYVLKTLKKLFLPASYWRWAHNISVLISTGWPLGAVHSGF